MPPRWNSWAALQAVQLDFERTSKLRPVRLDAPTAHVGAPVRVGIGGGVEIEGHIVDASTPVLRVKVKAAPLRAKPRKRTRTGTA
jgi:hypothetical protein